MRDPELRLDDLVESKGSREESRLLSVKLPASLIERIDRLVAMLPATRPEVIIAILNEGLDVAERDLKDYQPPPRMEIPRERRCTVRGCERERIARGLCATHYQAQRRARLAQQAARASAEK